MLLSGPDWLYPLTCGIQDTVIPDSKYLYPICSPWWLFNRMRILASGQVIEDIEYSLQTITDQIITQTGFCNGNKSKRFNYTNNTFLF